ncbi:HAD family hydrolase [Pseudonocardia nantongensis]|uniref:HAD family hydrolase n=1 Tax=Pseudonocardia nantongensis TaxID=1181885 RepID=UPI003978FC13
MPDASAPVPTATPAPPTGPGGASLPLQAVFLDLDNTIIAGSSALAFTRPFARYGLIDRATVLRGAWAQLLLVLAGADASTMDTLRRRMTLLCQGWEVERVRTIVAATLHEVIGPLVYPEARRLIERHRAEGAELVLLSASGLEVVEPIAALIGVDRYRATTMRIEAGRYAGEIENYCYGEGKAEAAREIAAGAGLDLARCAAYTDSITDLPLLEAVGLPAVVNPDRELRRIARERGWPVLAFVRARSRRDRLFRLRDRLADRFAGPAGPGPTAARPADVALAGSAWADRAAEGRPGADPAGTEGADRPGTGPARTGSGSPVTRSAATLAALTAAGGLVALCRNRARRDRRGSGNETAVRATPRTHPDAGPVTPCC